MPFIWLTAPHNPDETSAESPDVPQKGFQRRDLLWLNIDKIVRAFRRELLLPAIKEVAAQHQQERQQRQTKAKTPKADSTLTTADAEVG